MKQNRFWRITVPVCIALWTLFIWSQSLLPGKISGAESGFVTRLLAGLLGLETVPVWMHTLVRKAAHFTGFAILGTLWGGCRRLYPLRLTWLYGIAVAAADECLQFIQPDRGPAVTDVMIDTAGYLCGWALVLLVARLCTRKGATS